MKMQRTVYHFAGKDYEETQQVTLSFYVQRVSIQNFLKLAEGLRSISFGPIVNDSHYTYTDGRIRKITLKGSVRRMAMLCNALGKGNVSVVDDNWVVRNTELRPDGNFRRAKARYNGYSVFDPGTKTITYKSNSPQKIAGTQAVINGKLWRKYLSKSQ